MDNAVRHCRGKDKKRRETAQDATTTSAVHFYVSLIKKANRAATDRTLILFVLLLFLEHDHFVCCVWYITQPIRPASAAFDLLFSFFSWFGTFFFSARFIYDTRTV